MGRGMNGSRAIISIGPEGGKLEKVGIFNNVSWNAPLIAQGMPILGRETDAEIEYTGAENVSLSLGGWRVVGAGVHTLPRFPKVQDLMLYGYIEVLIVDRETKERILHVKKVKPTNYSGSLAAKQLSDVSLSMMGIFANDETAQQDPGEGGDAADLP